MANPEHVDILKQGVEVWNQWREEHSNIWPDLSYSNLNELDLMGADLSGTNLERSTFGWADLKRVNFQKAHLKGTNFDSADLEETSFNMATLFGTYFFSSNLRNASFKGAYLTGTFFSGAIVEGASFGSALLDSIVISNVDMSRVVGLEKTGHSGPSSIGLDTIYKSRGQIPEIFLRGCGVPENFIQYMKSLTMNPIDYFSCFISYSHQDKSFAKRLHDQLQAKGIRCWLDEKQMLPGDDIYEQVDRGIRMWDKVLLCCSRHSLASWWVDNEVATAFSKEQQLMKDRKKKVLSLIPLNLDGYIFSDEWTSGKRQQIKERLAADFTEWETNNAKFEEQFERVVKALQTGGAREEAPVSKL